MTVISQVSFSLEEVSAVGVEGVLVLVGISIGVAEHMSVTEDSNSISY